MHILARPFASISGPGSDAAPLGRIDVPQRLGELPLMAGQVLDGCFTLSVLVFLRLLQDLRSMQAGPLKLGVHIPDATLSW